MEAVLHGVCTQAALERLSELLQGLSAGPVQTVAQQHVCLTAPAVDEESSATEVHLLRNVSEAQGAW